MNLAVVIALAALLATPALADYINGTYRVQSEYETAISNRPQAES